jgi:hypothetical protein
MASDFVEVTIFCVGEAAIGILAGEEDNITDFMHCGLEDVVRSWGDLLYQCRAVWNREAPS